MFIVGKNIRLSKNMMKSAMKKEILKLIDECGISRIDFLEEMESVGQLPFTDVDYEAVVKKYGIVSINSLQ